MAVVGVSSNKQLGERLRCAHDGVGVAHILMRMWVTLIYKHRLWAQKTTEVILRSGSAHWAVVGWGSSGSADCSCGSADCAIVDRLVGQ